jgi:hypothetical protein
MNVEQLADKNTIVLANLEDAKWAISYPSRPARGKWHKIKTPRLYETSCSRDIPWDWLRTAQEPPEGVRICRQCLDKT